MIEFICHFGVPHRLHSDQETNFESKVFAEVCLFSEQSQVIFKVALHWDNA